MLTTPLPKDHTMITSLMHTVLTGDFLGYAATGIQEDHPLVTLALVVHTVLF